MNRGVVAEIRTVSWPSRVAEEQVGLVEDVELHRAHSQSPLKQDLHQHWRSHSIRKKWEQVKCK